MIDARTRWAAAGVLAGLCGLATSYAAAMALTIREAPVVAVADAVVAITPGPVAERAIKLVGQLDKPLLLVGIVLCCGGLFAVAGLLARRGWWPPMLVWGALALVGAVAVMSQPQAKEVDLLPVVTGFATWVVLHSALTDPLHRGVRHREQEVHERRVFLMVAGVVALSTLGLSVAGRVIGAGRRHVVESRRLLRLEGVTRREAPAAALVDLPGVTPWQTPNDDFYLIHTAISVPAIEPKDWTLRIHGLVEREIVLTYEQLLARPIVEEWVTLSCVSNEVGGNLVGNAWWSGVRIADLLAEAGVGPDADCVLQTSHDGWTCSTPLDTLVDRPRERDGRSRALLAIAMNGRPLPIEHGFPVRTVVPGLYGYVSATKWVVDLEVTRFADVEAFWTERGWSEHGPVKIASRIDVPRAGADVPAGSLRIGGLAWAQTTGIAAVEVALDGEPWRVVELAGAPSTDTWVQWTGTVEVGPGEHTLRVRATGRDGEEQTGVVRDVLPNGATGWHTVDFTAQEA